MPDMGGGPGSRRWGRWLAVAGLVVLAAHAGRTAIVTAEAQKRPAIAHAAWPSHPRPLLNLAFAEIGAAAARGQTPPAAAVAMVGEAARSEPLASEPLLVAATDSLAKGDGKRAEELLTAALRRDPRSTAGHFLFADLLIRQQRLGEAMVHISALGRRLGAATAGFAGALATYIREPAALAKVAPVLGEDPALRIEVLKQLSLDPAATAIMARLATPRDRGEDWLRRAVDVQLGAGKVDGARLLLARTGVSATGGLGSWNQGTAAGPLAWRYPSATGGVAEAVANGPMRLVSYGRQDASLAEHVLLLPQGRYRLSFAFGAPVPAGVFEWRLTCPASPAPPVIIPISGQTQDSMITIPAGCPSQKLAVWARIGDFPRTTSADLVRIDLKPVGGAA